MVVSGKWFFVFTVLIVVLLGSDLVSAEPFWCDGEGFEFLCDSEEPNEEAPLGVRGEVVRCTSDSDCGNENYSCMDRICVILPTNEVVRCTSDSDCSANQTCESSECTDVNRPPVVTITSPENGSTFLTGQRVIFSMQVEDTDENYFAWDTGEDNFEGQSGYSTYTNSGRYTVVAIAGDEAENLGSDTITITVNRETGNYQGTCPQIQNVPCPCSTNFACSGIGRGGLCSYEQRDTRACDAGFECREENGVPGCYLIGGSPEEVQVGDVVEPEQPQVLNRGDGGTLNYQCLENGTCSGELSCNENNVCVSGHIGECPGKFLGTKKCKTQNSCGTELFGWWIYSEKGCADGYECREENEVPGCYLVPSAPECATDNDCLNERGEVCYEGSCLEYDLASECRENNECVGLNNVCSKEIINNTDESGNVIQRTLFGTCTVLSPGIHPQANPDLKQNGEECISNKECASMYCSDDYICRPRPPGSINGRCRNDRTCDERLTCVNNICVLGNNGDQCTNNNQCASGICNNNECVGDGEKQHGEVCNDNEDCAENLLCDIYFARCTDVLQCLNNANCPADQVCEGNVCTEPQSPVGGQCNENNDCQSGLCRNNICLQRFEGQLPDYCTSQFLISSYDSDGDGIPEIQGCDRCPDTPEGHDTDGFGCSTRSPDTEREPEVRTCEDLGGVYCGSDSCGADSIGFTISANEIGDTLRDGGNCCIPLREELEGEDRLVCTSSQFNPSSGTFDAVTESDCIDPDGDGIGTKYIRFGNQDPVQEACTTIAAKAKSAKVPFYSNITLTLIILGIFYLRRKYKNFL